MHVLGRCWVRGFGGFGWDVIRIVGMRKAEGVGCNG